MCYIQILPLATESSPHVADAISLQRIDHAGIPTFTLPGTLAELLYIIGKFEQLAPIGCDLRQVGTPLPPPAHSLHAAVAQPPQYGRQLAASLPTVSCASAA